jgi:hypothetical protein
MKKFDYGPIPEDLPEEPGEETKTPIYFNITITNHGVCITAQSEARTEKRVATENAFQFNLFNRDWTNPIIIPISCINLYYSIYKGEGNLKLQLTPVNLAGFTDESPKILNEYQLEIVILFMHFIEKSNMEKAASLEQALKLKMIVLNGAGNNDTAATYELYKTIYERINSSRSDDDDSWMYRSRPTYYW